MLLFLEHKLPAACAAEELVEDVAEAAAATAWARHRLTPRTAKGQATKAKGQATKAANAARSVWSPSSSVAF